MGLGVRVREPIARGSAECDGPRSTSLGSFRKKRYKNMYLVWYQPDSERSDFVLACFRPCSIRHLGAAAQGRRGKALLSQYERRLERGQGNSTERTERTEKRRVEPEVRSPRSEARSPKPEARSQKSEVRGQKPEVRSPKPEARNQKPGVRSQKPEADGFQIPNSRFRTTASAAGREARVRTSAGRSADSNCRVRFRLTLIRGRI